LPNSLSRREATSVEAVLAGDHLIDAAGFGLFDERGI
jgi:hypothetical protein